MQFPEDACRKGAWSISLGTDLDNVANLQMSPASQHLLTSSQHSRQLAVDLIITGMACYLLTSFLHRVESCDIRSSCDNEHHNSCIMTAGSDFCSWSRHDVCNASTYLGYQE